MRDTAALCGRLHRRIPGRVALDHDDQVGLADQRAGVETRMHRMARRQSDRARVVADDRDGGAIRKLRQRANRALVRARPRRDDQRPLARTMPAWSSIPWPQWTGREREPNWPFSVIGVRPAARINGTRSRDRLIRLLIVLPVPTLTCTITACGRPVML